jgi:alpha-beta hydrolase superfamily lysophospholipase
MEVAGTPVYAVFHAAVAGRPEAPVVVHVHALGVEQLTLYRQEVLAARAVAARGFPVLRYHARGHGDSAGSSADATLASLVTDARAAADEARRRSGRARVLWLGVRLGAVVAAVAGGPGSGRDDAAGFVLWEPAERPADFFRQQLRTLLFSRVAGGQKPDATVDQLLERIEQEGSVDVLGYLLQKTLIRSFDGVTLDAALAGCGLPVLLAQVQARARLAPAHAALAQSLSEPAADGAAAGGSASPRRRSAVTIALVHDEPGYQLMSNPAWSSAHLTKLTMEWLDALA